MAQAVSANSVVITRVASGIIHAGHIVEFDATLNTVSENNGANTGVGVYFAKEDCAAGDHVAICVLGPCEVWADGTAAIVAGTYVASDGSGHAVAEANAGDRVLGTALQNLASGTAYIEVLIAPHPL